MIVIQFGYQVMLVNPDQCQLNHIKSDLQGQVIGPKWTILEKDICYFCLLSDLY